MPVELSQADLENLGFRSGVEIYDVQDAGVSIPEIMMALASTRSSERGHVEVRTGDTGITSPIRFFPEKIMIVWGVYREDHEHAGGSVEIPGWYVAGSQRDDAGIMSHEVHLYLEPALSPFGKPGRVKLQLYAPHYW